MIDRQRTVSSKSDACPVISNCSKFELLQESSVLVYVVATVWACFATKSMKQLVF